MSVRERALDLRLVKVVQKKKLFARADTGPFLYSPTAAPHNAGLGSLHQATTPRPPPPLPPRHFRSQNSAVEKASPLRRAACRRGPGCCSARAQEWRVPAADAQMPTPSSETETPAWAAACQPLNSRKKEFPSPTQRCARGGVLAAWVSCCVRRGVSKRGGGRFPCARPRPSQSLAASIVVVLKPAHRIAA
jgi:hypothetical protein